MAATAVFESSGGLERGVSMADVNQIVLFRDELYDQKGYFYSWLKVFRESLETGEPRFGQVLITL